MSVRWLQSFFTRTSLFLGRGINEDQTEATQLKNILIFLDRKIHYNLV